MGEVEKFLEGQNKQIKEFHKKLHLSYFDAIISGKQEDYEKVKEELIRFNDYLNNKERFEQLKNFLDKEEDPLKKRQLEILYMTYAGCQGDKELLKEISKKESEIEQKFNTFRAKVGGKELTDNEIKEILETETDSEKLQEAWEASKKQGALVERELIELVKLRNRLAKSLGFENYYTMSLELNEQTEEEIRNLFEEMEVQLNGAFSKLKQNIDESLSKRYSINKEELKPWHYQDLFFQEGPKTYDIDLDKFYTKDNVEIVKKFYYDAGFDVSSILEKSDLYEKPGKYQHACCIDMDKEGDVRIIENVKNNEYWAGTTLHELGHAIYDETYSKTNLPFLLKDKAHIFTTEAIALLFERNSKNTSFLKKYCKANPEEVEKIKDLIKKSLRTKELTFTRWNQVMFNFEKELYKNPDRNLNELWWEIVKKYQEINFSRDKPDWASKIHLASSPVYYHNYLLGKFLASQLNNYIVKEILKSDDTENPDYSNKEVGKYLKKYVFEPGNTKRWDKLIKEATGESLTPRYFSEEFLN